MPPLYIYGAYVLFRWLIFLLSDLQIVYKTENNSLNYEERTFSRVLNDQAYYLLHIFLDIHNRKNI